MAVGSLNVLLTLNSSKFVSGANKAKKGLKSVGDVAGVVTSKIFSLGGALTAAAGVGGLGLMVAKSLETGDALAKVSDKLGIATDKLAGLRRAGELTGVSTNTVDMALQRMTRRLSEAAQGTGEAQGALKELGLSAIELNQLSPDQAFIRIAKAMEGVTNQSDKVRLSFKLFDSEGVALVNTLSLGAAGLEEAQQKAKLFGTAISRVDAAKIEQTNDAITDAKSIFSGFALQLTSKLAPALTFIVNRFVDMATESGGMANFVDRALKKVVDAIAFVIDTTANLGKVWVGIKLVVAGAIAGIITALDQLNKAGAAVINFFGGDITPSPALSIWASVARDQTKELYNELIKVSDAPPPSEALLEGYNKLTESINASARAKADSKLGGDEENGSSLGISPEAQQAALDSVNNYLSQRVEAIRISNMEALELERERYEFSQLAIEEFAEREGITEAQKYAMLEQLAYNHERKVSNIKAAETKKRYQYERNTAAGIGNLLSVLGERSKTLSKVALVVTKANAIASTLANAASASMLAYASQLIPGDPSSVARAEAARNITLGLGAATAGAIAAQTLSALSGGGGGGGGGGAPSTSGAPSVSPNGAQESQLDTQTGRVVNLNVTVTGSVVGTEDFSGLIADTIRDLDRDDQIQVVVAGERAEIVR